MIILPSLEIVPAKYNTSTNTLLSQIPIDGTGDFTVTRATSPTTGQSTRVNALGLIELVPDNVPRLDYPIGGGCPALLIEPSATNLLTRSQQLDHGDWSRGAGVGVTGNVSGIIAPDGSQTASLITATTQSLVIGVNQNGKTVPTGSPNTKSVYLRGVVGGESVRLRDPNQTIGTTTCVLTTSWQRFTLTETQTGGVGGLWITNIPSGGIYAWGAQLEANSVPTSYIPTVASGITRAADAISDTTATALIGQTEGTIYFEAQCFTPSDFSDIIQIQGVGSNSINIIQNANNAYRMDLEASGVLRTITSTTTGVTGFAKIAIAYKTNELAISVNGGAPTTLASGFTFNGALTTIRIAHANYTALRPYRLRAAALYPTRLTDTQLALLTSPYTSYSSMASALSYTLG